MRFMVARKFGKIRRVRARNVWEIDVRPYGRFRSIPVQGSKPIRFTSEEIAREVLASIRAEIAGGKSEWAAVAPYLPRQTSTVDKIVVRYIDHLQHRADDGEVKSRTVSRFRTYAKEDGHFSWLYRYSIYEISAGHLDDWNQWLMGRPIHQNTRRHVVNDMRTIFRWLVGRDELERVPKFPTVPLKRTRRNIIEVTDQEDVLAAIPEELRGPHILAVEEAFRPGEIRALNLADYNFSTRTLTLQNAMDGDTNAAGRSTTKEDDIRVRRVSDRLAEWLERHIPPDQRANGLRPLFVNPRARTAPGGRFNSQALRNIWKSAATEIGFPQVSPYVGSKHSTLTAARRAGASRDVLMVAGGHKDPRSVDFYAEIDQQSATKVLRFVRKEKRAPDADRAAKSAPRSRPAS
jgi:integrase